MKRNEKLKMMLEFEGSRYLAVVTSTTNDDEMLSLLTDAEQDVVRRLLAGGSNQQIADQRGSSVYTVANQIQSIFRKLGVASRAELAVLMEQ